MKNFLKSILFLGIGFSIFLYVQTVFTPKHIDIIDPARVCGVEEQSLDAVFLGSSHFYSAVSPMEIYQETGIVSYVLATPAQALSCSYYLLEDLYETQSPSIVVLEAGSLFRPSDVETPWWKYIFDMTPPGELERKLLAAYSEERELSNSEILPIIVPMVEYHTRWNQLTKTDFLSMPDWFPFSAGQYIEYTAVRGTTRTKYEVNAEASALKELNEGATTVFHGGNLYTETVTSPLYVENISQLHLNWLEKLNNLCNTHGSQLVLTKIPVMSAPQDYDFHGAWTDTKAEMVKNLSAELGIPYVDMGFGETIGLDFTKDTMDGGRHLNFRGAEKVSRFWSEVLSTTFNLNAHVNSQYDTALKAYQQFEKAAILSSETDIINYLDLLSAHRDEWDIFISAGAEYTLSLSEEAKKGLESLGCGLVSQGKLFDCYIAILSEGRTVYEERSDRRIDYTTELYGHRLVMRSSSWRTGATASIEIDGEQYALWGQGLNFVVMERGTGAVIDSVAFDTFSPAMGATRSSGRSYQWLCDYRAMIDPFT